MDATRPIDLNNAVQHDRREPHQIAAWSWLNDHLTDEQRHEFAILYRSAPAPKPGPVVSPLDPSLVAAMGLIKPFEGCRLSSYPDPLSGGDPWTIGYGCIRRRDGTAVQPGDRISQQEAEELLLRQIKREFLPALALSIPGWVQLNSNRQGALLDFAWNLGAHFYGADGFQTISRCLRERDYSRVPEALLLYRNPGTNVEEGLRKRRIAEGNLWLRAVGQ
jgi:GH24 family phage-related lysozyme (muramidase)